MQSSISIKPTLLPEHETLLKASAIAPDVVSARGYYSETIKARLGQLGFTGSQQSTPSLVIPIWGANGKVVLHQIRPDKPRVLGGKAVKYETPSRTRTAIDVPPKARPLLKSPNVPLFITEGVRKADAAVSKGLCCIALLGVWNWRGTNEDGGKTVLADWEFIHLEGRQVYLAFDSDAAIKAGVQKALERLKAFLESRAARVKTIALPAGPNGEKVGLDDYFAAGHGPEDLRKLPALELSLAAAARAKDAQARHGYVAKPAGLFQVKALQEGQAYVQLTNFQARIVTELTVSDGIDQHREFKIEATVSGKTKTVTVAAEEFERMGWVLPQLGAEAIVSAGYGTKDHVRAAIQALSEPIPKATVYTHLGWVRDQDRWKYLHAGGAVGADAGAEGPGQTGDMPHAKGMEEEDLAGAGPTGPILDDKAGNMEVEVRLAPVLSRFRLPVPPSGPELVAAVRASLGMLDVAPDEVILALYAAVWRAPITGADFSLQFTGPTGAGKSELAALAQQHFGADLNARNLPGSWSSTANALAEVAFLAKDALMVVDDFVPQGSLSDVERAHRDADRLFRGQGNNSGRARCNRDGTPKEGKSPRGLLVSTGEEPPRGHSLNARILNIELCKEQVRWDKVTLAQKDAKVGLYAQAMAGFIRWLAARRDQAVKDLMQRKEELRDAAKTLCHHPRTASIAADLQAGFELFLEFAEEQGAISAEESLKLLERLGDALTHLLKAQDRGQEESKPVEQYLSMVRAAILTGEAHLADTVSGAPPETPTLWGWEEKSTWISKPSPTECGAKEEKRPEEGAGAEGEWQKTYWSKGKRIGWVQGAYIYLQPEASLAMAQEMARRQGAFLNLSTRTLGKALAHEHKLECTDPKRGKYTVRLSVQGHRVPVLCMLAGTLFPNGHDEHNYLIA